MVRGGPFAQADFVESWEAGFFGADAVTDLLILEDWLAKNLGIEESRYSRTEWKTGVFWRDWWLFFCEMDGESFKSSEHSCYS